MVAQFNVSVEEDEKNCIICVEDNGIGVSDKELEKLNNTPHYMVCDKKYDRTAARFRTSYCKTNYGCP